MTASARAKRYRQLVANGQMPSANADQGDDVSQVGNAKPIAQLDRGPMAWGTPTTAPATMADRMREVAAFQRGVANGDIRPPIGP
jgi:hypothetical protein